MDPVTPKLRKWLGDDGLAFFRGVKKEHGCVTAVWMETFDYGGKPMRIPHAVHFREGMQVRNFLRGLEETKGWTDHDYDNRWAELVEAAIK